MIQYEAKKEIQKILEKPKEESNNISFNISNYFFLFLGIPSNSSAFCSFITRESDETKANTTINPSINLNFIRLSSSSPKLASRKINLCFLDIKSKTQNKTPNKLFKLNLYTKDKTKKKETKEKENKENKDNKEEPKEIELVLEPVKIDGYCFRTIKEDQSLEDNEKAGGKDKKGAKKK